MKRTIMKQLILAIDDAQIMQLLLKNVLSSKYNIVVKHDGEEALEWLMEGNYPDLIIADLHMPFLNGKIFIENLQVSGLWRDIPIVILTSATDAEIADLGEKTKLLIRKPFNPRYLHEKLDQLLSVNKQQTDK
ncbi:response regulator [Olivibacter sitiensis]|uniref:response regulator n=1 Tax=Olivibacter sitiensis TaxID=376470 RepID=UPI000406987C|nr:response regulator [Olivibacter sitiensis]